MVLLGDRRVFDGCTELVDGTYLDYAERVPPYY
jgi:hypothetical protein